MLLCRRLNRISGVLKFFNGVDSSDRKISWVAWDNVLASKLNGGLGVSSFFALNRALLLKWVWRFISGDGSLWCKVIQAIYGSSFVLLGTINLIWCSILPDAILCVQFPRLFALELVKEIWWLIKWELLRSQFFSPGVRDGSQSSRRGVLLDSHLCPLCNAAMDDVQHVFFRCDVARVVLRKICRWWDLDWQEICSFSDWDAWFLSFRLSSRLKSILEGVFSVACGGFEASKSVGLDACL
ncbi:hypothetical protein Tco_0804878 [Tanacetum coccineum]